MEGTDMAAAIETNGLADAIDRVKELTKAGLSIEPKIIPLPQEKPGTYGVIMPGSPDGKIEDRLDVRVAGPTWHNERLETPAELEAFIRSLEAREYDPAKAVIYIGDEQISYHYEFEDRRHRAAVALKYSQPWLFLQKGATELSQRDLLRVLRITFDGCMTDQGDLIAKIRKLKFDNQGNVTTNLQHGNEAISKSLLNQISGVEQLPEEFVLKLKVYENYEQTVNVRVALELIADKGRFEIIAFPSQLETAQRETLGGIRDLFKATKVPAFIGQSRPEKD
jgi:hypothetical protein